ncbi:MAG: amidase family protein, partial [Methylococcales bacterium]
KIGLPDEFFKEGLDDEIAKVVENAVQELRSLGADVKEISLPNIGLSVPAYYVVAPAECSSNLSRFDGVRFGYRCEDPVDLDDLYTRSRGEGFGAEVKRRILIGTYALSAGYYDAYYLKAQKIRRLIRDDFKRAFSEVDVLVAPTSPSTAFGIGEKMDDHLSMYLSDIYTIGVNLAGGAAISVPAGFVQNKPVGMQIIGDYFSEPRLLNIAHRYQQVTNWHLKAPKGFE